MLQAIYFSPNCGTRNCVRMVAQAVNPNFQELDLTRPDKRRMAVDFAPQDQIVVGVPVYCGRIPQIPLFDHLDGHGAPTLLVAVYGNRAIDDALLELKNQLTARHFHCIGALAMLAPHCFVPQEVTPDRPDERDRQKVAQFVAELDWHKSSEVVVPGNLPYKPYPAFPFAPETVPGCTHCHKCEVACPVAAIHQGQTDAELCIRCAACLNICPQHCRVITHPGFAATQDKLRKLAGVRREIDCFK